MTKTLPRNSTMEIKCFLCKKLTRSWNRHHFNTQEGARTYKRGCVPCHDDWNYHLSPREQKYLSWIACKELVKLRKGEFEE